jgi:hypothetical protein
MDVEVAKNGRGKGRVVEGVLVVVRIEASDAGHASGRPGSSITVCIYINTSALGLLQACTNHNSRIVQVYNCCVNHIFIRYGTNACML